MNLKSLIGKLNDSTRGALEAAAGLCLARTHYDIEVEHYLTKLLDSTDNDVTAIYKHFEIDTSRLSGELARALDKLKTGNARTPSLSPSLMRMLIEAWTIGSIDYNAGQVRTGFTILALATNDELVRLMRDISREFQKIQADALRKDFQSIVCNSGEEAQAAAPGAPSAGARPGSGKTPNLDQFTINLTEKAKTGKIDPVLGRDFEIRQVVDILMRRRQNNPILTGEAGVGKTAVVEGFALRVAQGDVPPPLRNVTVRTLDLALLQAGAGIKGEFENRLKGLIEEVKSSPQPIILFIDEAHTMIGAGGQAGQGDAANLLKPALARGELRTIAATTWSEYKKYFEKDPALARRFQVVKVEEPTEEQCMVMLRGLVGPMEKHHGVRVTDEAIVAAVNLSNRYIPARQLPDKAVSLLDTACARVAISQNAKPAAVEDAEVEIASLESEKESLIRERDLGAAKEDRIAEIDVKLVKAREKLAALEVDWTKERALVEEVLGLRETIAKASAEAPPPLAAEPAPALSAKPEAESRPDGETLRVKVNELGKINPERRMIYAYVDEQAVASVVSDWTGIPVGKMVADEVETVLHLADILNKRIVGQSHGLEMIAKRIETNRARLDNPMKPIGVFMLCGPSGVGKTETALALAETLYGGEQNIITINMSELQEAHTVSTLKGAPPGYVGYGEGGRLTEAVRRRPYSVILLDEVEKAHPDVHEVFFQVFDKGVMEDGMGRRIDFKNTLILLTTNVGTDIIMRAASGATPPDPEALAAELRPALLEVFPPALLGRIVTIPYFPLSGEMLAGIVRLQLDRIGKRIEENHRAKFITDPSAIDHIVSLCHDPDSGGRVIDNVITNTILPALSREILKRSLKREEIHEAKVSSANGAFVYEVN